MTTDDTNDDDTTPANECKKPLCLKRLPLRKLNTKPKSHDDKAKGKANLKTQEPNLSASGKSTPAKNK